MILRNTTSGKSAKDFVAINDDVGISLSRGTVISITNLASIRFSLTPVVPYYSRLPRNFRGFFSGIGTPSGPGRSHHWICQK